MWINSLTIKNFRCFDQFSVTFGKGLNVLVGENNVGKSTVFVAVSSLFGSLVTGPREAFKETDLRYGKLKKGVGSSVKLKLSLNEQERKDLVDILFPGFSWDNTAKLYQLLAPDLRTAHVTYESQEAAIRRYVKLGRLYVLDDSVSNQSHFMGRAVGMGELERRLRAPDITYEDTLAAVEDWSSNKVLRRVGAILSAHFKTFAEFRARPLSSTRSAAMESLQGSETASVLLNLKTHHERRERARYEAIRSQFSNFLPSLSIEAVEREPGDQTPDIQFMEADGDYPIPLENVGAGVAELLTLLVNLVARNGCVFVIEEPELHLHPQAKRRLQELIRSSTRDNQVFVITHDPYFVEPDSLLTTTRFELTGRGTKATSVAHSLPRRVLAQLRTAMKDPAKREVVFARAVLLVEDESQQRFIVGCGNTLGYNLNGRGISVIPVDGADSFEPYVKLMEALKIPFLCLRDLAWGSTTNRPPERFRCLGCELEKFLEQDGLGSLLEEGRHRIGTGKTRVAEYVGEHIAANQVPLFFRELIADAVKLSEQR